MESTFKAVVSGIGGHGDRFVALDLGYGQITDDATGGVYTLKEGEKVTITIKTDSKDLPEVKAGNQFASWLSACSAFETPHASDDIAPGVK